MNIPHLAAERQPERVAAGCGCLVPPLIGLGLAWWLIGEHGLTRPDGSLSGTTLIAMGVAAASIVLGLILRRTSGKRSHRTRPITGTARERAKSAGVGGVVFGVFLLAGLGFLIPFGMIVVRAVDSRGWDETRCIVESSQVRTHDSSDGDTYSVDIRYRYERNGTEYRGDRYGFSMGSSSGYSGKAEIVSRFPPGAVVPCWVDPDDHSEATLHRGLSWEMLFIFLPLTFVGVGLLGILGVFGRLGGGPTSRHDWLPGTAAEEPAQPGSRAHPEIRSDTGEPHVLQASSSPAGRLGCSIVSALIWNGIVAIGVYFGVIKDGPPDGCLMAFLVVFGIVGLALLLSVPYHALALANPVMEARLGGRLTPGRSTSLTWSFRGRANRIRRLEIRLQGIERARYRQGTDTHTASNTFHDQVVFETADRHHIASGQATVTVPSGTMHSFDGGNNEIIWSLTVRGDIARWPDVSEEFVITIEPEGL